MYIHTYIYTCIRENNCARIVIEQKSLLIICECQFSGMILLRLSGFDTVNIPRCWRVKECPRKQNAAAAWRCYKTFTSPRGNCYGNSARIAPINFGRTKINIHLLAIRSTRSEEESIQARVETLAEFLKSSVNIRATNAFYCKTRI